MEPGAGGRWSPAPGADFANASNAKRLPALSGCRPSLPGSITPAITDPTSRWEA